MMGAFRATFNPRLVAKCLRYPAVAGQIIQHLVSALTRKHNLPGQTFLPSNTEVWPTLDGLPDNTGKPSFLIRSRDDEPDYSAGF